MKKRDCLLHSLLPSVRKDHSSLKDEVRFSESLVRLVVNLAKVRPGRSSPESLSRQKHANGQNAA